MEATISKYRTVLRVELWRLKRRVAKYIMKGVVLDILVSNLCSVALCHSFGWFYRVHGVNDYDMKVPVQVEFLLLRASSFVAACFILAVYVFRFYLIRWLRVRKIADF
nr:hypothetical protein CFP56_40009 [Quercus suber]